MLTPAIGRRGRVPEGPIIDVRTFGYDTPAIQAAADELMEAGRGTLLFQGDGDFTIEDTIAFVPSAHMADPFRITGDGRITVATAGTPGFYFLNSQAAHYQVRHGQIDSLRLVGLPGSGDPIKIEGADSNVMGATHAFVLRDLAIENSYGHAVHIKGYVFEFVLDNVKAWCHPDNTENSCIHLDGISPGKISSVMVRDCNTRRGKHGFFNSTAMDVQIEGGTFLEAQEEGIRLKSDGGAVVGAHVENNWQSAAGAVDGQAGLYFEGRGAIVGLKGSIANKQANAARLFADNGSIVVVGRSQAGATKWLYAGGNSTGTIYTIGVGASQISGALASVVPIDQPPDRALKLGAAETFPRWNLSVASMAALASGRLHLVAIYLPAGTTVNNISFVAGATALAAGTHQWFALYDDNRNLLATTSDDAAVAWGANSIKTLALDAPYTTTRDGLYYLGIVVVAGTVPTLQGAAIGHTITLVSQPRLNGSSDSGLTDPASAPNPAASIASLTTYPYASVS